MAILVGILGPTFDANATAFVKSDPKHIAQFIQSNGVIVNGELGVQVEKKEDTDSVVGTVLSILNWTDCIVLDGEDIQVYPDRVRLADLSAGLVDEAQVELAYNVACQIKGNGRKMNVKFVPEAGTRSTDVGWDYAVIEDTVSTDYRYQDTELRSHYVSYPDSGSWSYSFEKGIQLSVTAPIPRTLFDCTISGDTHSTSTFTYQFSCNSPGHRAFACRFYEAEIHKHSWHTWYWYIDYPGGPKNYTYLGVNYQNSVNRKNTTWYHKEEPLP